jgi:hypothetical protein
MSIPRDESHAEKSGTWFSIPGAPVRPPPQPGTPTPGTVRKSRLPVWHTVADLGIFHSSDNPLSETIRDLVELGYRQVGGEP